MFGVPIVAALVANIVLFVAERRRDPAAGRWALLSASLIVLGLIIFFVWVFPANQATENWTRQPQSWESLRRQWEYGHAANAVLVFAAFLATVRATVKGS